MNDKKIKLKENFKVGQFKFYLVYCKIVYKVDQKKWKYFYLQEKCPPEIS